MELIMSENEGNEIKVPGTRAELDAILRTDFLSFARAAFEVLYPRAFKPNWHHDAIAQLLLQSLGRATKAFINAPPRSLKSFLTSVAWVAFRLGHEPTHKFICVSYSQDLANFIAEDARRLMESEFYQRLFNVKLHKSAVDELRTSDGGYRLAFSVVGKTIGFGADTIIADDLLNGPDAYSEKIRSDTNRWFFSSLVSRLDDPPSGSIFVVAQRLHEDDLTARLIRNRWKGLVLPAIAPHDDVIRVGNWTHFVRGGELLQPSHLDRALLDDAKKAEPLMYQAQYLQNPAPDTGNDLKIEWLKFSDEVPERKSGDRIVFSIDTAMKATEASNYSVCTVYHIRNAAEIYMIHNWRAKVEYNELCDEIIRLKTTYQPGAILIEDKALGSALISDLKRDGISGIIGIQPKDDKRTRMLGQTTKLRAKCLTIVNSAVGKDEFLQEYRTFPASKHDDQIDALSQLLSNLEAVLPPPPPVFYTPGDMLGDLPHQAPYLRSPSLEETMFYWGRERPRSR
jgi:predicted phage terminase large subunit-like protein